MLLSMGADFCDSVNGLQVASYNLTSCCAHSGGSELDLISDWLAMWAVAHDTPGLAQMNGTSVYQPAVHSNVSRDTSASSICQQ